MAGALIGTGFPYNRRMIMDKLLKRLANFLHRVHDIRRTGSAAMDISYVACGRLDAYYEEGLQPWDVCAAEIILKEAGGQISKFNGDKFDLFFPETAASNPDLHPELLDILSKG
jgi:myo-inositol-1(or 4)-monophosphatase